MEILAKLDVLITTAISALGVYGPILGCFLICIESIVPVLPLFVFITLNFVSFGMFWGFIISWICTVFGCCLSFFLFRKVIKRWFDRKIRSHKQVNKVMNVVERVNFKQLVLIIVTPFTPAFLINIAAGLSSKMPFKRYLFALIIGKAFMVFFCGYVGSSLLESLRNPIMLLKAGILLVVAYLVSLLVDKKFNLDIV